MLVVTNEGLIIEVTERAFEVLYKDRGFKKTNEDQKKETKTTKKTTSKTTKKKTTSPTEKKVKEDDRTE